MRKILLITALFLLAVFPAVSFSSAEASLFSALELKEIAVKGHKLHIRGETDLPPGSMVHLDIRLPWSSGPGNKKFAVKVRVNSNHFFAMVDLPKKPNYSGLTVLLKAVFRPSEQHQSVKAKVGAKGEKIGGGKAKKVKGETVLEDIKQLTL
ncbi:hypothetical protein [Aminivibrio sp.]|jgi:hypothetical protein|uniref:hypothetical protein n=1 Tax=Aminivibrio sp. TaxID=1872489 RepID=UPI001A5E909E|nr:hypothetical protein [Aminivibrio sp.]MBL3539545.1 hypothetical protein [Aminivibrio sp.]MDK2958449.1 hypothetical protein [Synergistaceae bacterium]